MSRIISDAPRKLLRSRHSAALALFSRVDVLAGAPPVVFPARTNRQEQEEEVFFDGLAADP